MVSERLQHIEYNPWTGEHLHRYAEAAKRLGPNDTILDIACGTGYGTYQLSLLTKGKVFGGDIDGQAVELCKKEWVSSNGNLSFQEMDGTDLQFEDNYFDKVFSFETIEHTTKYREMARELHRVLKPGCTALISTPNILVNHPDGVVTNPYHTQEFTYEEFRDILEPVFSSVDIYGQEYIRYKKESGGRLRVAQALENLLLMRGVRKTPIKIQNVLMNSLIGKDLYPQEEDYELTSDLEEIKKSRTLLAICTK